MASGEVTGYQLHLSALSEESRSALHLATLEILEGTGVFVESPRAREILHGAGARVNGSRARIPAFLMEEAIRSAPERVVIGNRDGKRYLFLEGTRSYFTGVADCPYLLDPYSRSPRPFYSTDYASTAKVIDACPNLWGAMAGGNASDYPAEVRGQAAFKFTVQHTKKPFGLRNRLTCSEDGGDDTVAERVNKRTREIIEKHEVEPLPDGTLKILDETEGEWLARCGVERALET